jgi:hypothetical protein
MRKIALSLAILALAAVAATAPSLSSGAVGDTNGPPCRDITGGQFNYSATGTNTYNLNAQLLLGDDGLAAPCKQLTYTLYVLVDGTDPNAAGATPLAFPQDGSAQWTGITITDDDPNICVYATTSHNGKVLDTAPDSGCLVVTAGTTGGGGGFN